MTYLTVDVVSPQTAKEDLFALLDKAETLFGTLRMRAALPALVSKLQARQINGSDAAECYIGRLLEGLGADGGVLCANLQRLRLQDYTYRPIETYVSPLVGERWEKCLYAVRLGDQEEADLPQERIVGAVYRALLTWTTRWAQDHGYAIEAATEEALSPCLLI